MNSKPMTIRTMCKLGEQKPVEVRSGSGHHLSYAIGRHTRRFQLDLNEIKEAHKREVDFEQLSWVLFHDGHTL